MTTRVNSATLAPLLEAARTDPDPAVRHAALDVGTRLPLGELAWRALAATLTAVAQAAGHDAPERVALMALAARVPLLSVRRKLRSIAADAADPASATVRQALAEAGDESQTDGPFAGEPSGALDEVDAAPLSQQRVKDAVEGARFFLGEATVLRFDTEGAGSDVGAALQVMRILADAQASAAALPEDAPANLIVGEPVVRLVGLLPAGHEWPVRDLLLAQLGAARPALDDEQLARLIARAAPSRWIGPLVSLLTPPLRPAAERLRILGIAGFAGDHAAGRVASPRHGPGGAKPTTIGRSELIDDQAMDEVETPDGDPFASCDDEMTVRAPSRGAVADRSVAPSPPLHQAGDAAVFCPPVVGRGTDFLVQVMLHQPGQAAEAREQALEADASARRRGVLALPPDLPDGTRLDLHLEVPALRVDEPDAALVWSGRTTAAQFEVTVPAEAPVGHTTGRVRLSVAGVPVGTLRFQFDVASKVASQPPHGVWAEARRYRRAFVSYSSLDRAEVLRRVQAFRIAGVSVFQDILDLEPGQRWERELYREIDRSDVMLLFWSSAAAASPWVAKEIHYALSLKQGREDQPPDIVPVPIEGPPIPPGPESLRHLHFNDALLAHIAAAGVPRPG